MPMNQEKRGAPKDARTRKPSTCALDECGRKKYANGLCQTHDRQLRSTGTVAPIRPYRRREPGTVKFSGLRLTPGCAEVIQRQAKERNLSFGAVIAGILEHWYSRGAKPPREK
jgi:hypothetical protein